MGIRLVKGDSLSDLVDCFLPKILVLTSAMTIIHFEIVLRLHEKKEQDKEKVNKAYIRYIAG